MKTTVQACVVLAMCALVSGCGRSQYNKGEQLAEQIFATGGLTNLDAEAFTTAVLDEMAKRSRKKDKEAFVLGFADKGTEILVGRFRRINSELGAEVVAEQSIHTLFERLKSEATNY